MFRTFRYNNMSYKIDDIAWDKSPSDTFTNSRGETMSFVEYYKKQYQITIQDDKQPLLINRPKKKGTSELEADRIVCLVPELCLMTGLTDAMRADFKVMKDVAVITRVTPQARFDAIGKFIRRVKENPEAYKLLTDWGLQIADKPMTLQARVLEPEPDCSSSESADSDPVLWSLNPEKDPVVLRPQNLFIKVQMDHLNFCIPFSDFGRIC